MKYFIQSTIMYTVLFCQATLLFANDGFLQLNVEDAFGNQQFHLKCAGEGSPTLLLDGGSKYWSDHYAHLLPQLAEHTHTCLYDRPGYGQSSLGKFPRSSQQNADDIVSAIEAAQLETPLIIAGHSLGGINALTFAALYTELVAGVVLIDSAHPQQYQRFDPNLVALQDFQTNRYWRLAALQGAGIEVETTQDIAPWLSEELALNIKKGLQNGTTYLSVASELDEIDSAQSFLDKNFTKPLEVPLIVLTATNSFDLFGGLMPPALLEQSQQLWMEMQIELLGYSNKSTQQFSEGNHALEYSDPESIINAVKSILEQIKQ
ncbi:MAG: hypothetical protein COA96_10545 [SAR86 cluster bacterium]|uniref:AB hydrolase-1 domain-containing protein n=1 Tax=SAR86 cluster bacterium TaxID=2030880 RepID=A0A2A5AY34_9GAMM|nr:MAG: hypothetical protein COA96_10545 [SAR86 cluster bacterium]